MTYRAIGRRLGMSHQLVQLIEARALAKLRYFAVDRDVITELGRLRLTPVDRALAAPRRAKRCSRCGVSGHARTTCRSVAA